MKVFGDKVNDVSSSNLMQQSEFTISDGSKLIEMILDNAYTDPITATLREIGQNASDPMLGKGGDFHVHLPTAIEPWLAIIDDGIGLSKSDLVEYASGLGASTKDKNDTQVGGFGIGMKVPFTMCDQYSIIDRFEGKEYTFSAYKDDFGVAQFVQLGEKDTSDCNGLEIRVPVDSNKFHVVKEKMIKAYTYFDPKPTTNIEVEWEVRDYSTEDEDWGLVTGNKSSSDSRVIMGNLWYKIDGDNVREEWGDKYITMLQHGIDLYLPIGSVKLPLSREGILYTPATLKVIRDKLDKIADKLVTDFKLTIDKQPNIWEAMRTFKETSGLVSKLDNKSTSDITYKGKTINNRTDFKQKDVPFTTMWYVQSYRWRYKTMSMSEYGTHSSRDGEPLWLLPFSDNPIVVILVKEKEKRLPSRTISYMSQNYPNCDLYMFQYKEGTEHAIRKFIYTTMGLKSEVILFHDDVDDVSVNRGTAATRKKTAKVLTLDYTSSWSQFRDGGDIDLDTNKGIYIDLRRGDPHDCKVAYSIDNVRRVMLSLTQYDLVTEGTVLYGCPGSYKNKMVDHANFLSLDEAVKAAHSTVENLLTPKEIKRFSYLEGMNTFKLRNDRLFNLDIDINTSYYNLYRKRINNYLSIIDTNKYKLYCGYKHLSRATNNYENIVDNFCDKHQEVEDKFFGRYPLLKLATSATMYDTDDQKQIFNNSIEEYIKLKEFCNV